MESFQVINKTNRFDKVIMITEKPYLDWEASLTPNQVYANAIGISYLSISPTTGDLYWLESRASEKGRITLLKLEGDDSLDMTPNFNLRSRVHEYGGKPYYVGKKFIYFVNFSDQRIYKQDVKDINNVVPITPEKNADGTIGKYMDLVALPDESKLFFVYEQEQPDHSTPKNSIAWIDLTKDDVQEPEILVEGNDFYTEICLSPDGSFCIWLTWNLPYMPWDYTELWRADIQVNGLVNHKKIAGGSGESIVSPVISPTNEVFFSMDFPHKEDNDYQNYWNIYRYNNHLEKSYPVTKEFVEFGRPLWVSGFKNIFFASENELLCVYRKNGKSNIAQLQIDKLKLKKLPIDYTAIDSVAFSNGKLFFVGANPTSPVTLSSYEYKNNLLVNEMVILRSLSQENLLPKESISVGKLISFPTKDHQKAYGYLYLPKNSHYKSAEKPPLLVKVHGGPTGNSECLYSNYIQFWTSSGFAVLDIEHRGSTGFGRRFRDMLLGSWGEIDTSDVEDAITFLLSKHVISKKVAITGGSAGGYAVQRALTQLPDLFQVGASHFGIGNLVTLLNMTHKFESKYLNQIIGTDIKIFEDRSPINHLDKLQSPMIIFQGSEDKVVPPDVSREMAQILKEKGIKTDYIEYPGEGHGFRQLENKVDALEKESAFFREVLKST